MMRPGLTKWAVCAAAGGLLAASAVWSAGFSIGMTGAVRPKPKGAGNGAETVSTPGRPSGTASGLSGHDYGYSTGGSASSKGHPVEYRFNWGDGVYSSWSVSTGASHTWAADGAYAVTVEARCQAHPDVTAAPSDSLGVTMATETIGVPNMPAGATTGGANSNYSYNVGGAISNLGHPLDYRLSWGDGTYSSWTGAGSASHSWTSTGSYAVTAEARCRTDTWVASAASGALAVSIIDETVSVPNNPTGPASGVPGTSYSYNTGGATSNLGHTVQYRFNWADGSYSTWSTGTSAAHTWSSGGSYAVTAEARCQTHTSVASVSGGSLAVTVETVSTPDTPTGTTGGVAGTSYTYNTGGSTSTIGHSVEYRFDWGDGTYSSWSTGTSASHSWSPASTYTVKAQARCQADTGVVSSWSTGLTVVLEIVGTPGTPTGTTSGNGGTSYAYNTSGSTSNLGHTLEYRFDWGDGAYTGWSTGATASHSWISASTFTVMVQARCQADTAVVSSWSGGLGVVITIPSGTNVPVAGDGTSGSGGDGGAATAAQLNHPRGVAVDSSGNVYIADTDNNRIRKVTPGGIISTVAGTGAAGGTGDGGLATLATLSGPWGVSWNATGPVLYVADTGNNRVRKIDLSSGYIYAFAGTGTAGGGGDGGSATTAQLNSPMAVLWEAGGSNLYIADINNFRVRKVNNSNVISTVAGSGTIGDTGDGGSAIVAQLMGPAGLAWSGTSLYVVDAANRVRRVSGGNIYAVAGVSVTNGYNGDGITATTAWLNSPVGVAVDGSGVVYIGDQINHRVRKVDAGTI